MLKLTIIYMMFLAQALNTIQAILLAGYDIVNPSIQSIGTKFI